MTTVLLWLLINMPTDWDKNRTPTTLVERFATVEECERVRKVIQGSRGEPLLKCVQAAVVKP